MRAFPLLQDCEISTLLFSYVVPVKSKVEISQNFVAFSEYMNFNLCTGLFRDEEATEIAIIILLLFDTQLKQQKKVLQNIRFESS